MAMLAVFLASLCLVGALQAQDELPPPPTSLTTIFTAERESTDSSASRKNCWTWIEGEKWPEVVVFDAKLSMIQVLVGKSGPEVLSCLKAQGRRMGMAYELTLTRSVNDESVILDKKLVGVSRWLSMDGQGGMSNESVSFPYVMLRGRYTVSFRLCDTNLAAGSDQTDHGCEPGQASNGQGVYVNGSSSLAVDTSWCLTTDRFPDDRVERFRPILDDQLVTFSFAYIPCHKVLPYERARVSVLKSRTNETVCTDGLEIVKTSVAVSPAHVFRSGSFGWPRRSKQNHSEAVLSYKTPNLEGDHYYCLRVTSNHPFCQSLKPAPLLSDPGITRLRLPEFCNFSSEPVFVSSLPFISKWVPFCTSHFKCGWLYVTVVGVAIFLLSFTLAIMIVHCRCRQRRPKNDRLELVPASPSNLDTLRLADIRPKRAWADVHEELPPNAGKILLLYSPDSAVFSNLQTAFKNFLENACHCDVLDLFDKDLFDGIAYDPESWIDRMLRDANFKVVIVCSEGSFKRHQAITKGEVLNIPRANGLDGLFSAGLRFLQARQLDTSRLGMARYEMLRLSGPEYSLADLGSGREFLVPTQLHELFCWIHNYNPLDLLGKPWSNYNLELQLLQDALKAARMDRRS